MRFASVDGSGCANSIEYSLSFPTHGRRRTIGELVRYKEVFGNPAGRRSTRKRVASAALPIYSRHGLRILQRGTADVPAHSTGDTRVRAVRAGCSDSPGSTATTGLRAELGQFNQCSGLESVLPLSVHLLPTQLLVAAVFQEFQQSVLSLSQGNACAGLQQAMAQFSSQIATVSLRTSLQPRLLLIVSRRRMDAVSKCADLRGKRRFHSDLPVPVWPLRTKSWPPAWRNVQLVVRHAADDLVCGPLPGWIPIRSRVFPTLDDGLLATSPATSLSTCF